MKKNQDWGLFGRVKSRWCYDEAISIGFSRIRKHVFIFPLYSVLHTLFSILRSSIYSISTRSKKHRKSVIKPRKNSPFRTHPLRTRIILALIGCCSDHGSRRGQLAGHRGAASCSTNSPRIFLAIVVSCFVSSLSLSHFHSHCDPNSPSILLCTVS